jgi:hypothetical protein
MPAWSLRRVRPISSAPASSPRTRTRSRSRSSTTTGATRDPSRRATAPPRAREALPRGGLQGSPLLLARACRAERRAHQLLSAALRATRGGTATVDLLSVGEANRRNYDGFYLSFARWCARERLPPPSVGLDLDPSLVDFLDVLLRDGAPASGARTAFAAVRDRHPAWAHEMLRRPPDDGGGWPCRRRSPGVSPLPMSNDLTGTCSIILDTPAWWGPLLGSLAKGRAATVMLFGADQFSFLGLWRAAMTILGRPTVVLYQLRKGGATEDELSRRRPMLEVLTQGRWATWAALRHYARAGLLQKLLSTLPDRVMQVVQWSGHYLDAIMQGELLPCLPGPQPSPEVARSATPRRFWSGLKAPRRKPAAASVTAVRAQAAASSSQSCSPARAVLRRPSAAPAYKRKVMK